VKSIMPCFRFASGAVVLAALLVVTVGTGCAQTAKPELTWAPCGDVPDTECAGLPVPLDYAKPDSAKITLRIARAPAVDAAKRRGVLLLLPGGPGAGIMEMMGGEMRTAQHVSELQRQYDVVTFDPRGVGKSSPIRCDPAMAPAAEMPMDHKPTQAEFEAVARANASFIKSCADASGELLWHLSAKDTAQDIERIRQAVSPTDGIVSYGASYGSAYGAAYLEAYPENVKALILDGVVDHTVDFATFLARNVMSVQDAFERFAQWCAQDAKCELHGKDLGAAFDDAIAREPKTRTLVPQLLATGDHPELGWPALAHMLAEVGRGESKLLKEMTATATLSTADDPWLRVGKDGLFRAVMCADYEPQRDYAKLAATADTLAAAAPRFVWKFWDSMPMAHASAGTGDCAGWPRDAANPPHQLKVGPHRNVMVSNPTHDPATPLANAVSVWLQIPQARLLIADVDGHQSLPLSKCAYEAEARFLGDPEAVSSTTLCGK
jgi:pimeloyl-ACP methyl ester carboxylesterase